MSFEETVRSVFKPGGLLATAMPDFQPRQGQIEMAAAVARTLECGGILAVEAGTGIGKTFAYLVPALLSGTQVVLSTATKNLQDQLYKRDLPVLIGALGLPVRTALLKGRGSYLCLHYLNSARQNVPSTDRAASDLAKVESWALSTVSGDLAEIAGLDERSPVLPWVTSTRESCLGFKCSQFRLCHVNKARKAASAADLIVINHHLFFADWSIREAGVAELLPLVQTVIFDEAHQLNDIGLQFLGLQLSTGQLIDFAADLQSVGLTYARGMADWQGLAAIADSAARALGLVVRDVPHGSRLRWMGAVPESVSLSRWNVAMDAVHLACVRAVLALNSVSDSAPELARLCARGNNLIEALERFTLACKPDEVRWLDVGVQLKLMQSELNISSAFQRQVIKPLDGNVDGQRSWIFTSATLGSNAGLTWFTESCGLVGADVRQIGSPFNYSTQAVLYVPSYLPKPKDPEHSTKVAEFVGRFASTIGGRTLVLTTSLRALRDISEHLNRYFYGSNSMHILVQGQQSKSELIERFRRDQDQDEPGRILFASASFWEGVDIPGAALQMVVIDKLPFPSPDDPLVEARAKRLEANKRSVFKDYYIPEAAIALKQGAGRLIRHESDRGVLVVCDTRLNDMAYGRKLIATLPPMRRISSDDELSQALLELTKLSTKDPSLI